MENKELLHWGIKGMKWGVRRYQNKDGTLTPAGKKRYDNDPSNDDEQYAEEAKKRAMNSGDVRKVAAYRHTMSNEELRRALDRVDLEKRMNQLDAEMYKSGFDKTMSVLDRVDKVRGGAEKLVNTYNLVAKINNTFNKKFNIPSIDGKPMEESKTLMDKFLRESSADDIIKRMGDMTPSQLNDAANILQNRDKIRSYGSEAQAKKNQETKAQKDIETANREKQEWLNRASPEEVIAKSSELNSTDIENYKKKMNNLDDILKKVKK